MTEADRRWFPLTREQLERVLPGADELWAVAPQQIIRVQPTCQPASAPSSTAPGTVTIYTKDSG